MRIILLIICINLSFPSPPDWSYNPGDYSITATLGAAVVFVDGSNISDLEDILAAFDTDGNVRGIAQNLMATLGPYNGSPYHEMQIGSNTVGDIIIYKYYDATADDILNVESWSYSDSGYPYEFVVNDLIGNLNDPVVMYVESDDLIIIEETLHLSYSLENIFPNPFNPETKIQYSIPKNGNVELNVYSCQGRKIQTLINNIHTAGNHSLSWNASFYPSGVYLIRMQSGGYIQTRKMLLVK